MDDEKDLAVRASRYDRDAFGALYDRYVARIYQYVYYKTGSVNEAEDLTAQVFLRAWEAISGYEWRDYPFSAWLFRIARNLVVDYHRARRDTVTLDGPEDRSEIRPSGDDDAPEKSLQALFTSQQLQQAISQLTEEQQEVIVLRFIEGYSTAEIAVLMGKREGAVRGLQFRGLATLRELIHGGVGHEPR
ncbi:MAG: sigma-70 family RNA polymerase sigma factor [Anaerolineae bacterium]